MKIKSAKSFRFWYKTKVKDIEKDNPKFNENFLGTYHTENGKQVKGFFEMYRGHVPNIPSFLPSMLKIAEDGQAIYEFLQNAVDCNSTHFYIFYNEKYFLAINNGDPFEQEGIISILNLAQSTKKSCDKIGRFGIGFKLVHRLVGKNEGVDELTNQYKGPIIFSWSKPEHIQELLRDKKVEPVFPSSSNPEKNKEFWEAPYLFKILLTTVPVQPNEIVKDLEYKDRVGFSQEELNEMIDFLNDSFQNHSQNIKMNVLKHGSIFFLRLGEGKKEMLDRDYEDLRKGVEYSMNTLKKLQKVYINSDEIGRQILELEEFEILKNSKEFALINPEYKECNIKVSFGYYRNYKLNKKIKLSPNFYKYFPMGDETNGFSFIIHCDSFSNEANRRKLQKDNTNKNLLPIIANLIIEKLEDYKEGNREKFLCIYACLLLSDIPNKQNNEWLKPIFHVILLEYLCSNIPTKNNQYSDDAENVKINNLKININLEDFGLGHIQWFEWESRNDFDLILEAINSNKLGLEKWGICDIIENADIDCINEWIESQNQEQYNLFLNEIDKSDLRKSTIYRLCEIKLFKFSDDYFYSVNELKTTNNLVFNFTKTIKIKLELEKLGFITSEMDISKYENIFSAFSTKLPTDKNLYEIIANKCEENILSPKEKQKLFLNFVQDDTKFENIAEGTLRNLALFSNNKNEVKPLSELVDSFLLTPIWINPFKIKTDENFSSLKKYLISENEIYQEIILQNWDNIISEVSNVIEFYQKVKFYYDKDDKNTPLKKQAFIFINEEKRFVNTSDIFYNNKFSQISSYQNFQNAVLRLIDIQTPQKQIFNYLKEAPFEVKNYNLLDFNINNNTELSIDEVKTVLAFCKSNNENFFQECTLVEKQKGIFIISQKPKNVYQVRPSKKEVKQFIVDNLNDIFKILPYEFDDYKDEMGIIQGEKLYDLIIDSVNIDEYKAELIDFIAYEEPKRKFLLELLEVRFIASKQYNKESFEYKILNMACDALNETDYPKFREKIIIETSEQDLAFAEIPPFADKIKIEDYELSLAKILPNTYQNSAHLSSIIQHFCRGAFHDNLDIKYCLLGSYNFTYWKAVSKIWSMR